jgi:hypothetical protein
LDHRHTDVRVHTRAHSSSLTHTPYRATSRQRAKWIEENGRSQEEPEQAGDIYSEEQKKKGCDSNYSAFLSLEQGARDMIDEPAGLERGRETEKTQICSVRREKGKRPQDVWNIQKE